MTWQEVQEKYPSQWIIFEATEWHDEGERRVIDKMTILENDCHPQEVQRRSNDVARLAPQREIYFTFTAWETPRIKIPRQLAKYPRAYVKYHQPISTE